jgi:hypothetical protein
MQRPRTAKPQTELCYLCRRPNAETRDHIPPKGIFEEPRPSNLISVPCCEQCRQGQHDDDEFFRLFVCGLFHRNEPAARLWTRKVVPRTLKRGGRIAEMIDDLRRTATPIVITRSGKPAEVTKFAVSQDAINRVILRITRGLYFLERPHVDSSNFVFRVEQMDPLRGVDTSTITDLDNLFANHLTRGNQMFDCWWELRDKKPIVTRYVHMFARSAIWVILFAEPPTFLNKLRIRLEGIFKIGRLSKNRRRPKVPR